MKLFFKKIIQNVLSKKEFFFQFEQQNSFKKSMTCQREHLKIRESY